MSALEKLKQLEPIQFRYKAELDPTQPLRAGFSAQQVKEVIPEAVVEQDGYLMLDMNVLKKYVKEAKNKLIQHGRHAFGETLDHPAVWAFWWPRFLKIANWFVDQEAKNKSQIINKKADIKDIIKNLLARPIKNEFS